MKKRIVAGLFIIVFVVSLVGVTGAITITVCPSGCDYTKIQGAINSANLGDTIIVREGDYTENVKVNKSLTIKSENGAEKTIVTANDSDDHVFTIIADHVNLIGFTITGATFGAVKNYRLHVAGIMLNRVNGVDYSNISNNIISNNDEGIYITVGSSTNNIISNNVVKLNNYSGIYLGSSNNTVTTNTISNNKYGIQLDGSSNNIITDNIFVNDGLFIEVPGSYQNIITNNTVNGKPLVYLESVSDITITDAGQVVLVKSNNISVNGLTLSNTTEGIELLETNDSIISSNNVSSNDDGIYLSYSFNNNIINNRVNSNKRAGISLIWSYNNIIANNTALNNKFGVLLAYSPNNTIKENTGKLNNEDGIFLDDSSYNVIINNTVSDNNKGIFFFSSDSNTIINNTILNNNYGLNLWHSSKNILVDNIASNKLYGIFLWDSFNNTIADNTFLNNWQGAYIYESSNNTITDNSVNSNNYNGIYLYNSSGNSLTNNTVNSNKNEGISLEGFSNYNIITNNTIQNNTDGIYLYESSNNILTNNIVSSNNWSGIYIASLSNNNISKNTVCDNADSDILIYSTGNYGDKNTCLIAKNWNDTGTIGCSFKCPPKIFFCNPTWINPSKGELNCLQKSDVYPEISEIDNHILTISDAAPGMVIMTKFNENYEKLKIVGRSAMAYKSDMCLMIRVDPDNDGAYEDEVINNCWNKIPPYYPIDLTIETNTSMPLLFYPSLGAIAIDYIGPTTTTCKGDTDNDNIVNDFELLDYIDQWVQDSVSDFDLLEAISNWAKASC